MSESHLKTAGVAPSIRHQEDVSAGAIAPTADVATAFQQLKMRRQYRFVLFQIVGAQVVVAGSGAPTATLAEFLAALPDAECRYAVYDHEFTTADGRKSSKLFFVTWIPQSAQPGYKMAYTHAKGAIRAVCDGCFDVNAVAKKEIPMGLGISDEDASDSDEEFDD